MKRIDESIVKMLLIILLTLCFAGCQIRMPKLESIDMVPTSDSMLQNQDVHGDQTIDKNIVAANSCIEAALEYQKQGDYDAAILWFQKAINFDPECEKAYAQLMQIYVQCKQKDIALQTLETGIAALGGSQAQESEQLMALWWDTMLWNTEGDTQELSSQDRLLLYALADFFSNTECYLLTDELSASGMFAVFEFYADHYIEANPPQEYWAELYNQYPVLRPGNEDDELVILLPNTVKKLISDLFGIWREGLPNEYYALAWGAKDYAAYVQEIAKGYPEYATFADMDGAYFYEPSDSESPKYLLQGYKYLGDDMFYVVLCGDWTTQSDEEFKWIDGLVHLVVKRADTGFGFTLLAKPQDLFAEGNRSLIQPGWSKPALTPWE
jgi:tetratricopeptide (TPR) repeat protein